MEIRNNKNELVIPVNSLKDGDLFRRNCGEAVYMILNTSVDNNLVPVVNLANGVRIDLSQLEHVIPVTGYLQITEWGN